MRSLWNSVYAKRNSVSLIIHLFLTKNRFEKIKCFINEKPNYKSYSVCNFKTINFFPFQISLKNKNKFSIGKNFLFSENKIFD